MREAVKLLINRAHTHPEEFTKNGKFHWVHGYAKDPAYSYALTARERAALLKIINKYTYEGFHREVLRLLLGAEK